MKKIIFAVFLFLCAVPAFVLDSESVSLMNEIARCYSRGCDRDRVLRLIAQGAKVNQVKDNATPLYHAASVCDHEMAGALLGKGADPDRGYIPQGHTPLMRAATCSVRGRDLASSKIETARVLLKHGAKPNARTKNGGTALMEYAVSDGNHEIVKMLVEKGAGVNLAKNPGGDEGSVTALMYAARNCQDKNTVFLISRGADVSAVPRLQAERGHKSGLDAVQLVASYYTRSMCEDAARQDRQCAACMKALLSASRDPAAKNRALTLAAHYGNVEMVRYLIDAGAGINSSPYGAPALIKALSSNIANRCTDTIGAAGLLLEKGADVNARDEKGWTAFMYAVSAAASPGPDIVKGKRQLRDWKRLAGMFLSRGADVNARDRNGLNALMLCAMNFWHGDQAGFLKLLIEKGADVNAKMNASVRYAGKDLHYAHGFYNRHAAEGGDWGGRTALMFADHPEAVRILIKKGADVNARDAKGRSVLRLAKTRNFAERDAVMKILAEAGAKE